MLAQVKKHSATGSRREIAARLGAWWEGRDYVAPEPEAAPEIVLERVPATMAAAISAAPAHAASAAAPEGAALGAAIGAYTVDLRVKALGALWGEGRLAPGSMELDALMLDAMFEAADHPGHIGFLGADAMVMNACAARTDRRIIAAEWRSGVGAPLRELAPAINIAECDIDRPKVFSDGAQEVVATIEAFAYSDHKAGLVGRVHRALSPTGRWVFLDTTRTTAKTPPEAFASAWAEPQLTTANEIEAALKTAGFASVRREPVTHLMLAAARKGYARIGQTLDTVVATRTQGRDSAVFLQELSWEAQSWRARMRALEGGALEMNLWIADKMERVAPPSTPRPPPEPVQHAEPPPSPKKPKPPKEAAPLAQSDIDSLFD